MKEAIQEFIEMMEFYGLDKTYLYKGEYHGEILATTDKYKALKEYASLPNESNDKPVVCAVCEERINHKIPVYKVEANESKEEDGWTQWNQHYQPVDTQGEHIEYIVKNREDGAERIYTQKADILGWNCVGESSYISAYRLIVEEKKPEKQTFYDFCTDRIDENHIDKIGSKTVLLLISEWAEERGL